MRRLLWDLLMDMVWCMTPALVFISAVLYVAWSRWWI